MRPFTYERPATLEDALARLDAASRPLAGGTDLLTLMKADLEAPGRLVALKGLLPQSVRLDGERLTLGAATTLAAIERDPAIAKRYCALAQAAAVAATAQLRNMATLGGNLLQRPRCWYFRNPHVRCWLKGGEHCPAREGENGRHALFPGGPCVAVHPSDLAPALLAFDAVVRVRGPHGERHVPMAEFLALPEDGRRRETTLHENELVIDVSLPAYPGRARSTYLKAMDRQAFSFALVGVAAVLRLSSGRRVEHARIVLSGVAPIPWRARAAERLLLGPDPSEPTLQAAADAALEGAAPLRHNAWKMPLASALVERALQIVTVD
jgi:xanthine dehydrogenase YagS FAD-binding subunit